MNIYQISSFNVTSIYNPSGIVSTFIVNIIICFIYLLFFFFCLKRIPIFNTKKKIQLYLQIDKNYSEKIETEEDLTLFEYLYSFFTSFLYILKTFHPYYEEIDNRAIFKDYGRTITIYLLFQRCIITCLLICSFISLIVLFPVHMFGQIPLDPHNITETSFLTYTSVTMVLNEPWKLITHVFLAIFFTLILIYYIYMFYNSNLVQNPSYGNVQDTQINCFTSFVQGISKDINNDQFYKMMKDLFPNQVQYAIILWDVSERIKLKNEIDKTQNLLEHYFYLFQNFDGKYKRKFHQEEVKLYQLIQIASEFDQKYNQMLLNPTLKYLKSTGTGFVTFYKKTDLNEALKNRNFNFKLAEDPKDIDWLNMITKNYLDYLCEILTHIILIILLVFFTTPFATFSAVESIGSLPFINQIILFIRQNTGYLGDLIFQYFPTLFIFILSILFIPFIYYITQISKYKTKSKFERVLLTRVYTYLMITYLLLPALLLTSIDGIIQYLKNDNIIKMFETIFLPSNGAFFVNFMIQFTLLKNFQDLVRFGDIIYYLYYYIFAYTIKEQYFAAEAPFFLFSIEYAFMLTILAIIFSFGLFSPLIMIFGTCFFLVKHLFDRYILKLIYKSKIPAFKPLNNYSADYKMVKTIINYLLFNIQLSLIIILIFFALRIPSSLVFIFHTIIILLFCIIITKISKYIFSKKRIEIEGEKNFTEEDMRNSYDPCYSYFEKEEIKI